MSIYRWRMLTENTLAYKVLTVSCVAAGLYSALKGLMHHKQARMLYPEVQKANYLRMLLQTSDEVGECSCNDSDHEKV